MTAPTPPFDLVIGMDRSDRKVDLHLLDLQAKKEDSTTLSTDSAALRPGPPTCVSASPNTGLPSFSSNPPTTSSAS